LINFFSEKSSFVKKSILSIFDKISNYLFINIKFVKNFSKINKIESILLDSLNIFQNIHSRSYKGSIWDFTTSKIRFFPPSSPPPLIPSKNLNNQKLIKMILKNHEERFGSIMIYFFTIDMFIENFNSNIY